MKPYIDIGIDLGTTFSVIAVPGRVELKDDYPEGIYIDDCDVTIIPTPYGEVTFPSVIVESTDAPGEYLYGSDALAGIDDGQDPVMFSKRKIGTLEAMKMASGDVTAKDIARAFLSYFKTCAETALGMAVRRAVVTHPAHFNRNAVEETRQAAVEAGFDMKNPDQMLMEPVAAALTYTRSDERDPLRILTYDLGGGTFDVTFLERNSGVIEMKGFGGDHLLGGYNFDRALAQWILKNLERRGKSISLNEDDQAHRLYIAKLLQLAERVKLSLAEARSDDAQVQIRGRYLLVDTSGKEIPVDERITRKEYVNLISDDLGRTIEIVKGVIQKAKIEAEDIDALLLVGGSSKGPWIKEQLQKTFPNLPCNLFQPDLCVAIGAALYAKMILAPLVADINRDLELIIDVPDTIALDQVVVQGSVNGQGFDFENCTVRLVDSEAGIKKETSLNANGGFSFGKVELEEIGINTFNLAIIDSDNNALVEHTFTIAYQPESTDTSAVVSVLPRTIAIETADGMIPIAEAGASLPARFNRAFSRQNDNPNMTLRLYNDLKIIGEIRIENIPPGAGIGTRVDLQLEVTEQGQVLGTADFIVSSGKSVLSSQVEVFIKPQEIPSKKVLEERFARLLKERETAASTASPLTEEQVNWVGRKIKQIRNLFEQIPLERQEIEAALDELERFIEPPKDDMQPTLPEFLQTIEKCRAKITEFENLLSKGKLPQKSGQSPGRAPTQEMLKKKIVKSWKDLDKYQQQGEAVYQKRDRKNWAIVTEAANSLTYEINCMLHPEAEQLHATDSKLQLTVLINRTLSQFQQASSKLKAEGRFEDWRSESDRIIAGLNAALNEVTQIKKDLNDSQVLNACRVIYQTKVRPLMRLIQNLGIDISAESQASAEMGHFAFREALGELINGDGADDQLLSISTFEKQQSKVLLSLIKEKMEGNRQAGHDLTPLIYAVENDKHDDVSALLKGGANVDERDNKKRTALMYARSLKSAQILVAAGADIDAKDDQGMSALLYNAQLERLELVEYLLHQGADIDLRWEKGHNALHLASLSGHLSIVELLLDRKINLEARCELGRTPLHYASQGGHQSIVEKLLPYYKDIDDPDKDGSTPFHLSILGGHIDIVRLLLKNGANPNRKRHLDKCNPLIMACYAGHVEIVRELVAFTEDLNAIDKDGDTAMINAAYRGDVNILSILINHGCEIDAQNFNGQTPLIKAIVEKNNGAVEFLLQSGADPIIKTAEGLNARDYAIKSDDSVILSAFNINPPN